jgi:hypothetical protein
MSAGSWSGSSQSHRSRELPEIAGKLNREVAAALTDPAYDRPPSGSQVRCQFRGAE